MSSVADRDRVTAVEVVYSLPLFMTIDPDGGPESTGEAVVKLHE